MKSLLQLYTESYFKNASVLHSPRGATITERWKAATMLENVLRHAPTYRLQENARMAGVSANHSATILRYSRR
jgi:hypothetical protein